MRTVVSRLALCLLLATSGCSLVFVPHQSAEDGRVTSQDAPACNSSFVAPVVDHALAGFGWPAVGTGGALLSWSLCRTEDCKDAMAVGLGLSIAIGVIASVTSYLSGRQGLRDVAMCRALETAYRHRRVGAERTPVVEPPGTSFEAIRLIQFSEPFSEQLAALEAFTEQSVRQRIDALALRPGLEGSTLSRGGEWDGWHLAPVEGTALVIVYAFDEATLRVERLISAAPEAPVEVPEPPLSSPPVRLNEDPAAAGGSVEASPAELVAPEP